MSKTAKYALLAAVVAIGISSSVLAQSREHGLYAYGLVNGRNAYDLAVSQGSGAPVPLNAPAYTGGGSSGYNAYLPKNTD